MKQRWFRLAGLVWLVMALSGCFKPETPQEVTEAFWTSVVKDDVEDVVELSTLTAAGDYDHFSKNWKGANPSWGKVIIDAETASIATKMSGVEEGEEDLEFVTYLVRQGEDWVVDYEKTRRSINPLGVLKNLFGGIEKLGEEISRQFDAAADDLGVTMESLATEFSEMADSFQAQAKDAMARHGERLRHHLDELTASIERAMKEQEGRLSDQDRRVMNDLILSLEASGKGLSEGDAASVGKSGQAVAEAQHKLESLDSRTFGEYQARWRSWSTQIESDLKKMLDDVKAGVKETAY